MTVSVVIPVYNRELELRRALRSVQNQTVQDLEILVIDDCSEIDLNERVIIPLVDNRIKYYRLENKGNANVCRNLGIQESKGKYIAMLDSDDEWLPTHLESKIKFLEEKKADGVFGSVRIIGVNKQEDAISTPLGKNDRMINYLLSQEWAAPTPTHVYKAECAKLIPWDEELRRHQDWDFSVRFANRFEFIASQEITCLVHIGEEKRRGEQFDSLIKFIERNKSEILPGLYHNYHRIIYERIYDRADIDSKYKIHYKREMLHYMDVVSLRNYLSVFGKNRSRMGRFLLRVQFVCLVLLK